MARSPLRAENFRRVQLHALRHTCVCLLVALGVHRRTVTEIVGHSAIEMTVNVYGHVSRDTQRAALGPLTTSWAGRRPASHAELLHQRGQRRHR